MIIYSGNKTDFIEKMPQLPDLLRDNIMRMLGEDTSENEFLSWKNSLRFMRDIVNVPSIPDDAGIALEYNIPVTNNRIDFIVTGTDDDGKSQIVIIELKQWSHVQKTDMDGIVITRYEDGLRETTHPSYQAACYASLLYDYKQAVQNREVYLHPCAYLHNMEDGLAINDNFYRNYTAKAPVFIKNEADRLRDFISTYIRRGDRQKALFVVENSQIRPSKNLMDSVNSMMKGNAVFKMIDAQKVAFQRILNSYTQYLSTGRKQVVIVKGGPGTGKTVIAVNLLSRMTTKGKSAAYVTKNNSPRNVIYRRLVDGGMGSASVDALFRSSSAYVDSITDIFDMLIVDEAHRLNAQSVTYQHVRGENQIKEIINAAKVSVFFIDEAQRVDIRDIGTCDEIRKWAEHFGCMISDDLQLTAQFRCGGSDEYLRWLDNLLEIQPSKQKLLSPSSYMLRICDTPNEVVREIKQKNRRNNKSRVVAGYCWPWTSQYSGKGYDIVIPEYRFRAQWNLKKDKTWSITEGSVNQIGCIHTCQGLEFDYVGVIIGKDLIYRDGHILTDPEERSKDDYSIHGYKKMMRTDPERTKILIDQIIKNTYRVLMTRGMKGCYLYVMDYELREYIKSRIIES